MCSYFSRNALNSRKGIETYRCDTIRHTDWGRNALNSRKGIETQLHIELNYAAFRRNALNSRKGIETYNVVIQSNHCQWSECP